MLTLGIPKEIKAYEKRVALTPEGVRQATASGIPVWVETGAGKESGFFDEAYRQAGARIAPDAGTLYREADLIQKVKEPLPVEYPRLKQKIVFSFLHLASPENCHLLQVLLDQKVTAIGYETLEKNGFIPILAPMSEIAGALAAIYAAVLGYDEIQEFPPLAPHAILRTELEKAARLYPGIPEHLRLGNVVIFGGGAAGRKAAEYAVRMKAQVTVIERNAILRDRLRESLWSRHFPAAALLSREEDLSAVLAKADVLIGCAHRAGYRAEHVLHPDELAVASLQRRKILLDVAIDQGGNFPESRATDYGNPVYLDSHRNLRFGVANMPSFCGPAASAAITETTLVYTLAMAQDLGLALQKYPELAQAINTQEGVIRHEGIRQAHQR